MNKSTWLMPILLAIMTLIFISNMMQHRSAKPAPTAGVEPYVEPAKPSTNVAKPPLPFVVAAGSAGEVEALAILLKYKPDATDEERREVMGFSYHTRFYRSEWQREVNELKEQKHNIETNEVLAVSGKDEMLTEWGYRWKATVASLEDVSARLYKIDYQTMVARGYSEAMLSELWALAHPTGRMPWEE